MFHPWVHCLQLEMLYQNIHSGKGCADMDDRSHQPEPGAYISGKGAAEPALAQYTVVKLLETCNLLRNWELRSAA